MKIGFIGCVESSRVALDTILSLSNVDVVGVITKEKSPFNSDHIDLSSICDAHNIPYHYEVATNKCESFEFMKRLNPDVIYCFGWSYLLNDKFLSLSKGGVIGFHPAKLPQNRGRHPIIWSIILGLDSTASTFFKMDLGADSGPILDQKDINIDEHDDAKTLYEKIIETTKGQIKSFTTDLVEGKAGFKKQDESLATYWRKRSRKDGLIDWRMTATGIHQLIKALTTPYPGAEFKVGDDFIQVWHSKICINEYPINIEPGKVLLKESNDILIKCSGTSAIWLNNITIDLKEGDYL